MMLARNIGEFAVTERNRTKVLRDASLAYPAMEEAILGARQYVHVEYYIFEPDATGRRFLELLAEKARAGLEVRLLVDHFGSGGLTRDFLAPFLEAGGQFSFCMETRFPHLLTLWRLNYRNHRKIIVVDGATGFTGGMNIGDNYLGRDHRVGYWRDMHLQLDGPAVEDLQRIFAEDWLHATGEILADPRYLLHTLREGFVFYGALIGGLGGVAVYALRKKLPFFSLTDYFIPGLVLGHAFGRVGCFFAGCCYGTACDTPISIVFPAGGAAPAGVPLLPTQLMESAFLFLLCAFLVWRLAKKKPFGTVSGWYMALYGVWRFAIEFFRNDERGFVGALSTSQFISIFVFLGGVALLLLVKLGVLKKTVLDLPVPVEEEPKKKAKKDEAEAKAENEVKLEEKE